MNTANSSAAVLRRRVFVILTVLVLAVGAAFAVQYSLATASTDRDAGDSTGEITPGSTPVDSVIAPSEADGVIFDGAALSVFDQDKPAIANLDPALLDALHRAATDAATDGVEFVVNSGWRSEALQQHMLQEAVADYGSEQEAARWVATSAASAHVTGDAVDLGPLTALDWLAQRGSAYGLCQIYANESWHYELRPEAVDRGCPQMYADPTQDPRMQG
ncbi:MAG: M15 family metallopeptidase [Microbacteriaceae bacterium]